MISELKGDVLSEDIINSDKPILLDFWGAWCKPCQVVSTFIEEIDREMSGKIDILKINVTENPRLVSQYEVLNIPALIILKKGKIMGKLVGSVSKEKIIDFINNNII